MDSNPPPPPHTHTLWSDYFHIHAVFGTKNGHITGGPLKLVCPMRKPGSATDKKTQCKRGY